jgi:hypothetical protein
LFCFNHRLVLIGVNSIPKGECAAAKKNNRCPFTLYTHNPVIVVGVAVAAAVVI